MAYIYGMMVGGYEEIDGKERYVWYLRSGSQDIQFSSATTYRGQSGDMVGVVLGTNRDDSSTIREIVKLQEIRQVKVSDFFESQGEYYVRVGAHTIKTYSETFSIYVDQVGQQVRIVVAN